jgi:RNA polymerase sigma-70 factor (ECF subfamily)
MPPSDEKLPLAMAGGGTFHTTHWSVVLAARQADPPGARQALEQLCRAYWYPLYAYLRREGWSEPDAEDLTQGFFAHLFEHQTLDRATREKGRFRSFLLASLKYYVAGQRAREQRQKRGGGRTLVSLDAGSAEERYRLEPRSPMWARSGSSIRCSFQTTGRTTRRTFGTTLFGTEWWARTAS